MAQKMGTCNNGKCQQTSSYSWLAYNMAICSCYYLSALFDYDLLPIRPSKEDC
jgi:hypothetical protein